MGFHGPITVESRTGPCDLQGNKWPASRWRNTHWREKVRCRNCGTEWTQYVKREEE